MSNTPSDAVGMTLRDRFAIAALTGIIHWAYGDIPKNSDAGLISADAYRLADAMMAARGGYHGDVATESERCAAIADEFEQRLHAQYKTGSGPERGSSYIEGGSDVAGEIAMRIRTAQ